MRKTLLAGAASAASLALVATPAFAANPQFKTLTVTAGANYGATATFKVAGLGANTGITVTLTGDYKAVFQCINGGGKNAKASAFTEESGTKTSTDSYTSDKNGNVTGTKTLAAPVDLTTNTLTCPSGQTEKLTEVTWSVTASSPGLTSLGPVVFKAGQRL